MKLEELARSYREAEEPIRRRLRTIRKSLRECTNSDESLRLRYRELRLQQMLTQLREVAEVMERYYERSYYRNEKYRL